MAYFPVPRKPAPEFVPVPEGPNYKMIVFVAGLALIALVAFGGSLIMSRKPAVSASPIHTPPRRPSPAPTSGDKYRPGRPGKKIELDPAILDDVEDTYSTRARRPEEYSVIEKGPLLNVLQYLLTHTEEEIEANLTVPHPVKHPLVTWEDMMTRPREVRGATVIVEGVIKLYDYGEFEPSFQRESGVQGVWYGNLFYKDKKQYAFRLLEGGDQFKVDDVIRFYGVFLKRMWFRNNMAELEGKNTYSIMPLVIAKRAYPYTMPEEKFPVVEVATFFVLACLLVIALGYTLMREVGKTGTVRMRFGKSRRTRQDGEGEKEKER